MGTLAYMAPEQLRGELADARSDQFSLCAALAEALGGVRPFEGSDPQARLAAMARPVELDRRIPSRVRAVLARGLAFEPSARFPSMGALLAAPPPGAGTIVVSVGEKTLVWIPGLRRVAIGDPEVADVELAGKGVLQVSGVARGETSLIVWAGDESRNWRVSVVPPP